MARNTYTLDGIPLTDPDGRWFFEKSTGIRIIPAKRMPNISYPGVDGDAFTPGGTFLPGGVRINMYVEGEDHEEFMYNVEYLNALFLQRHKLLELRHDYDLDGSISRHAFVKVISSTEVQPLGTGMRAGTIAYNCEVPGVFWRSFNANTLGIEAYPEEWTTNQVTILGGGNAPVDDAIIRVKGGFSKLEIEDYTTRSKLVINTALTDEEYIIIDTKNWTARKVDIDTWLDGPGIESGAVDPDDFSENVDMSVISNRGMGSMFIMEPSLYVTNFVYRIKHKATNPVGSPRIDIRAKKSYL